MVGTVTVRIEGLKQLEQALSMLPVAVQGKALASAARKGSEVIRQRMQDVAPVRQEAGSKRVSAGSQKRRNPGYTKAHIRAKADKEDIHSIGFRIGPTKGAFYAMDDEFGSKHQPASPKYRPAFENTSAKAIGVAVTQLGTNIEREAKRLSARVNFRYFTRGK